MSFEVNFAIQTWNVSENVLFVSKILVLVVEDPFGFGKLQLHFQNSVKLWNSEVWFQKMSFVSQKAVFIYRKWLVFPDLGGHCVPP